MSRVKIDDFEKYEQSTSSNNKFDFFNLDNDGDSAVVRFMYESLDEIEGVAVHTVSVNGKDRKVACLREYGDPLGNCPFCEAKLSVSPRLFLEMKQYERTPDGRALTGAEKTVIWERGRSFIKKLTALAANYSPLCDYFFIVTRCGKKGDTNTSYEVLEYRGDSSKVVDRALSEEPYDPVGTLVWDKNYEEMKVYLETQNFPRNDDTQVVRRDRQPEQQAQPQYAVTQQPYVAPQQYAPAPQYASQAYPTAPQIPTSYPQTPEPATQPVEPTRRRRI